MELRLAYFLLILIFFGACARPIANFSYQDTDQVAPAQIQFDNNSEKAERFEWDFGDGSQSQEESPVHEYNSSGNYKVILRAYKGKKFDTLEKSLVIDAPKECMVIIDTEFGQMTAVLYNDTPKHRDNFIKLAEEGFYDDLLFHRVIDGFMIQGGDPDSRQAGKGQPLGSGGPNYTIPGEFVDSLIHVKGALAAARLGDQVNPSKASSGSQFYIVQGRSVTEQELKLLETRKGMTYSTKAKAIYLEKGGTPFLDGEYTVFGRVVEGLEVIDRIAQQPTGPGDRPQQDIKMKIRVIK